VNRILFLRGGFETGRAENGLTAGFGVQLQRKQFLIRVDYAYADMGGSGIIHYSSLDLSPLWQRTKAAPPGRDDR